jgi:hypothetical protein
MRRYPSLAVVLGYFAFAFPGCRLEASEPLDLIARANRETLSGITSARAVGRFSKDEATSGEDWKTVVDADIDVVFTKTQYHLSLNYRVDNEHFDDSRRVIYNNGTQATVASFSNDYHPTGAHAFVFTPFRYSRTIVQPVVGGFPWDVRDLSGNILNIDSVLEKATRQPISIEQPSDGDLIATFRLSEAPNNVFRFKCSKRVDYRMTRRQIYVNPQATPIEEVSLGWKKTPGGLWYVASMQELTELRNANNQLKKRVRQSLRYSKFEANPEIGQQAFSEESLGLPDGTAIVDAQEGRKSGSFRIYHHPTK